MNCESCIEKKKQANEAVPFRVVEANAGRQHEIIKRLITVVVILAVLLTGSWVFFFVRESMYVDEEWTFEAHADGDSNAIANGNGEVYYYGGNSEGNSPGQENGE